MYSWVNMMLEVQLCLGKKTKTNNLTKVVYFTGKHTLPDVITSKYPYFENLVD